MRILILIFAGFLSFATMDGQSVESLDCSKFRVGTFHMMTDYSGLSIIKRNNNFQIETNQKLGTKVKLKVQWIDNCTYKLTLVKGKKKGDKEYKFAKMPLIVTIVSTDGNSYTQISKFEGYDEEYKNVIKKIK